jgi:phosphoglucomutase
MIGLQISPMAGKVPDPVHAIKIADLIRAYFTGAPDPSQTAQRIHFGTSGHRGSAFRNSFNENHVLAIAQSICMYREHLGISGPLFLGIDTHALSGPAFASAVEVFAANNIVTMIDLHDGYTPTPVISHAILTYNRARTSGRADGVVLTPSHNPPEDGGFKYNSPNGGPADAAATNWIEATANSLLENHLSDVRRVPFERARRSACVRHHDYLNSYVSDLESAVDMKAIRASGLTMGIDPLGGASVRYWADIIDRYDLNATIVNDKVDPTFGFMTADWDGKIRMDCSSPYAMARLIGMRDRFDLSIANDTDADRHGIVSPSAGLMAPNHYLAVAIAYLFDHRPNWGDRCAVGKTMVSSSMIDWVVSRLGRGLVEVPVGFKWFVEGLYGGTLGFAGEESAGASFLRRDGSVWTTDKDGLVLGLLAAELTAASGRDPGQMYDELTREFGECWYQRIDSPATRTQMDVLRKISPDDVSATKLAGEPIQSKATSASHKNTPLGGIKVSAEGGWFAIRPSGTEEIIKIYAESFQSKKHLGEIQLCAETMIESLLVR